MDPWPNRPGGGTFQYVVIDLGPYQNPDPNHPSPDHPPPNDPAPSYRSTSTGPPSFESSPPSSINSQEGVTTVPSPVANPAPVAKPEIPVGKSTAKSTDKPTDKSQAPPTIQPIAIYQPPISHSSPSHSTEEEEDWWGMCACPGATIIYLIWFGLLIGGIVMLKVGNNRENLAKMMGSVDFNAQGLVAGGVIMLCLWGVTVLAACLGACCGGGR